MDHVSQREEGEVQNLDLRKFTKFEACGRGRKGEGTENGEGAGDF